jgi:hypothetical protein
MVSDRLDTLLIRTLVYEILRGSKNKTTVNDEFNTPKEIDSGVKRYFPSNLPSHGRIIDSDSDRSMRIYLVSVMIYRTCSGRVNSDFKIDLKYDIVVI